MPLRAPLTSVIKCARCSSDSWSFSRSQTCAMSLYNCSKLVSRVSLWYLRNRFPTRELCSTTQGTENMIFWLGSSLAKNCNSVMTSRRVVDVSFSRIWVMKSIFGVVLAAGWESKESIEVLSISGVVILCKEQAFIMYESFLVLLAFITSLLTSPWKGSFFLTLIFIVAYEIIYA